MVEGLHLADRLVGCSLICFMILWQIHSAAASASPQRSEGDGGIVVYSYEFDVDTAEESGVGGEVGSGLGAGAEAPAIPPAAPVKPPAKPPPVAAGPKAPAIAPPAPVKPPVKPVAAGASGRGARATGVGSKGGAGGKALGLPPAVSKGLDPEDAASMALCVVTATAKGGAAPANSGAASLAGSQMKEYWTRLFSQGPNRKLNFSASSPTCVSLPQLDVLAPRWSSIGTGALIRSNLWERRVKSWEAQPKDALEITTEDLKKEIDRTFKVHLHLHALVLWCCAHTAYTAW